MARTTDTRSRLIEATIDLLSVHSYGAVTVDEVCERAGVKKGSLYHFFASKEELVLAALDAHWEDRRAQLDRLFSPTEPPLDRLVAYFRNVHRRQADQRARYGHVIGCFYTRVGMECADANPELARRVKEILSNYEKYYVSALRDAESEGQLARGDARARAKSLFAFMEGMLGQARIRNDVRVLARLEETALELIGAEPRHRAAPASRH